MVGQKYATLLAGPHLNPVETWWPLATLEWFGRREQSSLTACFAWVKRTFATIATAIAHQSGRPITFLLAAFIVIVWAVTGPIFHYSDTWQLIINTGTTIITFLMVFVIQNTQNRDGAAVQAKLDELIRVSAAQNILIGIEQLTEDEISDIREKCLARAKKAENGAQKKARAGINRTV
jgi:low affinity Fe/Cu permease